MLSMILFSANPLSAASNEGLAVSFKTHSMFDEAAKIKGFYGPSFDKNGTRVFGDGAACLVVWVEDLKGNLVKTLGRWSGNTGYNGRGRQQDSWELPRGDSSGRAYDLVYWNGVSRKKKNLHAIKYSMAQSDFKGGGTPKAGMKTNNCYDCILGPTLGTTSKLDSITQHTHGDLLSTTEMDNGLWNMKDRHGKKIKKGNYRLIIEMVEWEDAYDGSKGLGSDKDYLKTMNIIYDGKEVKLSKSANTDDVMGPSMMNPSTNKMQESRKVIYDISVTFTTNQPDFENMSSAEKKFAKLIYGLKSDSDTKRKSAARKLGKMGAEAEKALDALKECLDDKNKYVKKYAAESIAKIEKALAIAEK